MNIQENSCSTGTICPAAAQKSSDDCENIGAGDHILPPDHTYPEGGYGWLVVVATFIVCFWTLGLLMSWGVFKEFLMNHQTFPGANIQQLSWIGPIGVCTLYLVAPLVALLTRPLGIRPVWCLGVVLACGGILASSFATKVWQFYLTFGLLFGSGSGIIYFASLVVLSQYFYKHRGFVAGLGGAGASIGTIALAPLWRLMLEKFGVPWALRIMAAPMFLTLCIVFAFIRPRDVREHLVDNAVPLSTSRSTVDQGACPIRGEEADNATTTASSLNEFGKPTPLSSSSSPSPSPSSSTVRSDQSCQPSRDDQPVLLSIMPSSPVAAVAVSTSVAAHTIGRGRCSRAQNGLAQDHLFRQPRFILLWITTFVFMCGYLVPLFLVPMCATKSGVSPSKAASLISISTAASLVSRIILGLVGDRLGVFNTSLACFTLSSLSCFVLWFPAHDYPLLVAFMLVYGIFAGGLFILLPVAATLIVGQERLPAALGLVFVANGLGGLVGSPIGDAIVTASGGEDRWAILFTGLTLVASTALCAVLRFATDRRLFHVV